MNLTICVLLVPRTPSLIYSFTHKLFTISLSLSPSFTYSFAHTFLLSSSHSRTHVLIHPSLIHSLHYSFIYSLLHYLLIHSLTHSLTPQEVTTHVFTGPHSAGTQFYPAVFWQHFIRLLSQLQSDTGTVDFTS